MDNQGLIPYGLILAITSFLILLGGGFMERLGGPAVQSVVCSLFSCACAPPSLLCLPSAVPVDLVWSCLSHFSILLSFGSVLKKSFGKDTETRCVSPSLVMHNIFINVILGESRVKWLLPCPNESNSTIFFVCVCKDHLWAPALHRLIKSQSREPLMQICCTAVRWSLLWWYFPSAWVDGVTMWAVHVC